MAYREPRESSEASEDPKRAVSNALSADERSQVAARLRLSPAERLRYLVDMLRFEALAQHAHRVD
jgi:hypothetical protein